MPYGDRAAAASTNRSATRIGSGRPAGSWWRIAPARIAGAVAITIAAGKPDDRRRRDLDNIATKAVLDLLTAHQVIADDSRASHRFGGALGRQYSRRPDLHHHQSRRLNRKKESGWGQPLSADMGRGKRPHIKVRRDVGG